MNTIPLDKGKTLSTVEWVGQGQGFLRLIDQTRLPTAMIFVDCQTIEELWESIHVLRVRGAPAIGVAAAILVVSVRIDHAYRTKGRVGVLLSLTLPLVLRTGTYGST